MWWAAVPATAVSIEKAVVSVTQVLCEGGMADQSVRIPLMMRVSNVKPRTEAFTPDRVWEIFS